METFIPRGVCSRKIYFNIENDIITHCEFIGGCAGNTQGVAKLVIGRKVEDVIEILKGIQCRGGTSCPDQLSKALQSYLENKK